MRDRDTGDHRDTGGQGLTRRDLLKMSVAAGAALVFEPLARIARVVVADPLRKADGPPVSSEIICGMETFGSAEHPLDQVQVNALAEYWNGKAARGETRLDNDKVYATHVIRPETYKHFEELTQGRFPTYQAYMETHGDKWNEMFASAGVGLQSVNRRLLVAGDEVFINWRPASFGRKPIINDSDGVVGEGVTLNPFIPQVQADGHDPSFIHEFGHRPIYLPDLYNFDCSLTEMLKRGQLSSQQLMALEAIPEPWRQYGTWQRRDRNGGGIMSGGMALKLDDVEKLILQRRALGGWTHDWNRSTNEAIDVPNRIPHQLTLRLDQNLAGADVALYRTSGDYWGSKYLEVVFADRLPSSGELDISDVFASFKDQPYIPSYAGTYLITAIKDGAVNLTWGDAPDTYLGIGPDLSDDLARLCQVRMTVPLAGANDLDPETFYRDNPIGYKVVEPNLVPRVWLPVVYSND